ncbi:MAG: POTRA domain-containing protein [Bacteriovoracia bacterium]
MKSFLILLLISINSFASSAFTLNEVNVECEASVTCEQRRTRFKGLVGDYRGLVHLKDTLRVMASDGGYQTFTYTLDKNVQRYVLNIKFQLKPFIDDINVGFTDRNLAANPQQLLSIKEGDFFETQKLKESIDALKARLEAMGYPKNSNTFEVIEKNGEVDINIIVTLGEPRIFKSLTSDSSSPFVRTYLKRKFLSFYNKPFDTNSFKIYLDEAQKELFNYGYYLINLEFIPVFKGNRVSLDIKVTNDQLFAFDFKNLQRAHRDVIHGILVDLFRKYKRPLSEATLVGALKEHYRNKALLKTRIRVESSEFKNRRGEIVQLYRIFLDENGKTRLVNVTFDGNSYFSNKRLQKMFDKEAFELASLNYYDEEYFSYFQDYLRNQYIKRGFVQVKVFDPAKIFSKTKEVASVEYDIQEGPRAFIRSIQFEGLSGEIENKMLDEITNKAGKAFNPIAMVEDIKRVVTYLQEQGYYYAEVVNVNDAEIVKYNKAGTEVYIKFKVDTGPLVKLNRILYLGNDKTRKSVLAKKIPLEKGELITPSKTRDIETTLSATGLFNSVSVTPIRHSSKNTATDLLVKVSERDYGLIEIAPGFRTDLGIKLTGTISYQNIGGKNQSLSLRSQLNRRTSFTTIDPERRDEIEHIIEHNTTLAYAKSDIYDTLIDGAASMSYQTRRFYAFDANIFRMNGTLSRDITRTLSSSIRYQIENINQYNATEEINDGSFRIGSVTPNFTLDLRNSQINPVKGAYFNLSTEFANPYFLSQKESDLTVNYYKLISRNRFYVPFKNGTVAISLVGGVQENLAKDKVIIDGTEQTEGYIPTIKVFRLTGMDIIRGFTDEEMNRLPNGDDISEVRVSDKAYMANLKVEPRYFINDSLMAGVFYDAGRVFVDHVDFGELRDSVGLTFKVITPVGTLDFDYGIKLLRKKDADGNLEDPGRFHVSIGFF